MDNLPAGVFGGSEDGGRRPGVFAGKPDDFGIPDFTDVGIVPELLPWDVTEWLEADRDRFVGESLTIDSICAPRT